MSYDLLLVGRTVVDVGGGHVRRYDVAVKGGRVAAVSPDLREEKAREVRNVSGKIVTAGLIDLHTHPPRCGLLEHRPRRGCLCRAVCRRAHEPVTIVEDAVPMWRLVDGR